MELEEAIEKTKALLNLNDILFEETGTHLYLGKQEKELIQILLNHLTKQEKMIELMVEFIDTELSSEHLSRVLEKEVLPLETYRKDIKQYFEKKVEEYQKEEV